MTRPKGKPAPGQKLPALVWAHGGGGIFFTAKTWDFCAKKMAKSFGSVVINVDLSYGDEEAPASGKRRARPPRADLENEMVQPLRESAGSSKAPWSHDISYVDA